MSVPPIARKRGEQALLDVLRRQHPGVVFVVRAGNDRECRAADLGLSIGSAEGELALNLLDALDTYRAEVKP